MTVTATSVRDEHARPARLRRLPGLDGLRAIAVVAVIVYHLNPSVLPGGYLGVDVFFVLSGYLITSILLAEFRRRRAIFLPSFWKRRARRLLPAVVVLLVVTTVAAALFARDTLGSLRIDLPAALFYVVNWRFVFEHRSYISSLGRPPLLLHLWSLSVEEQFYLLWPPALYLLARKLRPNGVAAAAAVGAIGSTLLMALLYGGGDPSAVYFNTFTHAQGLLIGSALAAALPPWRMAPEVSASARQVVERVGAVALAGVVAGMAVLGFDSSATYRGGLLAVDVATAVVIAAVAHPACRLGPVLSRQPLRWLGLRSYSLYLWHWPIFVITRPGVGGVGGLALRLGLTAAAAEASYRWIEQPWRTGRAQAALRGAIAAGRSVRVAVPAAAVVALVALVLSSAPTVQEPAILRIGETAAARTQPTEQWPTTAPSTPVLAPLPLAPETTLPPAPQVVATTVAPPPPAPARVPANDMPVLALGDSVLLAASPALQQYFGAGITVDAAVGRQVTAGLARLEQYRSSGALSHYHTVVIDLGTNGTFNPAEFAELAQLVSGVPVVVLYDVHADRSWIAASNSTITAGVAAHPGQMSLVDWNRYAAPNLLYDDGIHPNSAGAQVFASLLVSDLASHPTAASPAPAPSPTTTVPPPAPTTTTTKPPAPTTTAPPQTTTTTAAPPPTTAAP